MKILPYIFMLIGFVAIGLISMQRKHKEKIEYCHVDSTLTLPITEFIPETMFRYTTNCGIIFTSKREFNLGDSVQKKTIIIN